MKRDSSQRRKVPKSKPPKEASYLKKPKTAYTHFQLSVQAQIWKEIESQADAPCNREVLSRSVARLTGQRWKSLPAYLKEPFQKIALHARLKYKQAMLEHTQNINSHNQNTPLLVQSSSPSNHTDLFPTRNSSSSATVQTELLADSSFTNRCNYGMCPPDYTLDFTPDFTPDFVHSPGIEVNHSDLHFDWDCPTSFVQPDTIFVS